MIKMSQPCLKKLPVTAMRNGCNFLLCVQLDMKLSTGQLTCQIVAVCKQTFVFNFTGMNINSVGYLSLPQKLSVLYFTF